MLTRSLNRLYMVGRGDPTQSEAWGGHEHRKEKDKKMTVRDYVRDMVQGQNFSVEVRFYDKNNEWIITDTFDYSIPHKACQWLDNEVKYFRAFGNGITLCIDDKRGV